MIRLFFLCLLAITFQCSAEPKIQGEDGYRLWLKYDLISDDVKRNHYLTVLGKYAVVGSSPTFEVVRQELSLASSGLLGEGQEVKEKEASLIIAAGDNAATFAKQYGIEWPKQGDDGYFIHDVGSQNQPKIFVLSKSEKGALYGTFRLLKQIQTDDVLSGINVASSPKVQLRVLNHWDNLDGHVERGYAGRSIWNWHKLPGYIDQRYVDYARANASIGINGTVLNNVNADPLMLTPAYLQKVRALADLFRPYGIQVYLSVKFSSPQLLGGLETSDPLEPGVQKWWREKVSEIYKTIPDFGGFLVKANSEGQPGPGDFGRTHAEGANMLAAALQPFDGIVMWRAFVYANEKNEERSKQAYSEFKPLDGQFANNVLVQVKNGPIDFQPREPFSPLFGATPETPLMMEFQITMEYLGFSTHMVYLGTMYEEVLESDTFAKGEGSTVAKVIDGQLFSNHITGMAGVANIGADRNWTGNIMLQSNWYVFGRMAWDPEVSAREVANDWTKMTLSHDPDTVDAVTTMLMDSHEITVNYMTPLGLHHIMGAGHHFGPAPWVDWLARDDWNSVYYHKAAEDGVGFDRSPTGVNSVEQYFPPLKELWAKPETTPEKYLLWFHHLPWDYRVSSSGRTLWNEIVHRYYQGAEDVARMAAKWNSLKEHIDPLQFEQVRMSLAIQQKEAIWWRDACVLYFMQYSQQPLPDNLEKPSHDLEYYQSLSFPHAPGQG
ncbi:alpha-glucuronidase family glycosyl hydrolase [Alteromonas confluentis]|uniref:Xylan alpha-1,2-glucuronidase n=1 Tax=Alteromonas confluentis TaxID=1656094 RepID=A0A1E7Z7X9_9ALTE|nr:alpha-glucuronidase family glycosyl hydrolase [Alteromonas confluentis]OFC69635.1 alpha-glucuronidase [Alteromonas confluentis]